MKLLTKIRNYLNASANLKYQNDKILINEGIILSEIFKDKDINKLADIEFSVFSQFGDDGIIQYIVNNLQCSNNFFIEFGVGNYFESNTRFLMHKNNWSGFVMDGSLENISQLKRSYFYWQFELKAMNCFIDKNNINKLLNENAPKEVGILHIDLDGNDYWIWREIDLRPDILILEYNSLFGYDRPITIPYSPKFNRTSAHQSNLFWGASLKALYELSIDRGYSFLGCNSAGNNAYFVKRNLLNNKIREVSLEQGFVKSKYRESRNLNGELSYMSEEEIYEALKNKKVYNTKLKLEENLFA